MNGIGIRRIISKGPEMLTSSDLREIREIIDALEFWPWTPGKVARGEVHTSRNIEFITKAPDLILTLCDHIKHLHAKTDKSSIQELLYKDKLHDKQNSPNRER